MGTLASAVATPDGSSRGQWPSVDAMLESSVMESRDTKRALKKRQSQPAAKKM